jgi:tetratricopeptide (TPR) repeat protein
METKPKFDDALLLAAKLFRDGRKFALLDQTVDSISSLLRALDLLNPLAGADHRLLRAEVLNQLGMVEIWRGRYGTAHDMLDEATKLDPSKGMFWAFLSQTCCHLGAKSRALETALKADGLDPLSHISKHSLAQAWLLNGEVEKAAECYRAAGENAPKDPDAYYQLANCFYIANMKDEAEEWYHKAIQLSPDHADANYGYSVCLTEKLEYRKAMPHIIKGMDSQISGHASQWSKALAHLILGEYEQGFADHEVRFVFMRQEYGNELAEKRFDKPQWKLGDKGRVHIYHEQGFGDALQYCRFVKDMESPLFEVDKSMVSLFKHNFPNAEVVPMATDYPGVSGLPEVDYRIPLGSMPYALGTSIDTVPYSEGYLNAEPEYIEKWKWVGEAKGRKIGLCWAGGKRVNDKNLVAMDAMRSVSFPVVRPLLDVIDCTFYSLQTGLAAQEIDDSRMIDAMKDCQSWSDTAAIIHHLDLVISVDTSVLHMAAAMGKPTYLLNKYSSCWRWLLDREDSVWYDSLKIFRQADAYHWGDVIDKVRAELWQL